MSIETELKLSIPPEHMGRLKRHPALRKLSLTRAQNIRLYSVYYDTPKLDLHRHAMALRLRRSGRQWLQTLKGGGGVEAGLHRRNEWETPVAGEALEFDALKAMGGHLPKGVRKKLQPVFVTDFSRNLRLLEFEEAQIELCLDSGEIRSGDKQHEISELELELKSGTPQQLFRLALQLLEIVPLSVEQTSKAEYGYRLFGEVQPAASKAGFPALEPGQDIGSALQAMIVACLSHVQANVPGAVAGLDEEYLHQVRVGLRRLRVVLAMAESWRADDELAALHEEVADMCVEFGRLREWDVFITETLAPVCERLPQHEGLRELMSASQSRRAATRAPLVARLQAPAYQRLLLRFGIWLNGPYWTDAPHQEGLPEFAGAALRKRCRQVARRGKHHGEAGQLHLLRIACKKLRYSAEMFASLYPVEHVKRYTRALSKLQDIMGHLNDIAVAARLLDVLENEAGADAPALVRGWLEHDRAELTTSLAAAWKHFAKQRIFWPE